MLVAAQLALTLLLLTGAGLLVRSIARLTRTDHLGFTSHGVVVANLRPFGAPYHDLAARPPLIPTLPALKQPLPGAQLVGRGAPPLVAGAGENVHEGFNALFAYRDTTRAGSPGRTVWVKHVDEGYLETFGIPLRSGRGIRVTDDANAPRVALLNGSAARLFFPGRNPIGMTLPVTSLSPSGTPAPQVVGIPFTTSKSLAA
jgi:hypothetical protein